MNAVDQEYLRVLQLILDKGVSKKNRTNIDTISIFGVQSRYSLSDGFPILTTKKINFTSVCRELLWFLSGSTNVKYLIDNNVHIWDDWVYEKYVKKVNSSDPLDNFNDCHKDEIKGKEKGKGIYPFSKFKFAERIKEDQDFANRWGDLGYGSYSSMWRKFETVSHDSDFPDKIHISYIDQISNVIKSLKNNPDSRRHIVSAWHPYWAHKCLLSPCHILFQFNTSLLSLDERTNAYLQFTKGNPDQREIDLKKIEILSDQNCSDFSWEDFYDKINVPRYKLDLMLTQRSCDFPVGAGFNISSYCLLLCMVGQIVNMIPHTFVHSIGDCHIYKSQIEGVKEHLKRKCSEELPELVLNKNINNIFSFSINDINLINYNPNSYIKMPIAV